MNKWLSEIEIAGTNSSFGKDKCRQFVDDTRPLVDGLYESLKRNVKSNYGKVVISLWSQSRLDEFSVPSYQYDDIGGVLLVNYAFEIDEYLYQSDVVIKQKIVYEIFNEVFSNLPDEAGLSGSAVMHWVDKVCRNLNS